MNLDEVFSDHRSLKHSLIKKEIITSTLVTRKVNVVVNALSRKSSYVSALSRVITHEKRIDVKIRTYEVMRFYNKIHLFDVTKLRKLILQKGLSRGLSVRPRATRMYQNLREMFGWPGLKEEVTEPIMDEPNCLVYPDQC
ncbi:hypothetical protein CR513_58579, partial [Mucuna pruriens]